MKIWHKCKCSFCIWKWTTFVFNSEVITLFIHSLFLRCFIGSSRMFSFLKRRLFSFLKRRLFSFLKMCLFSFLKRRLKNGKMLIVHLEDTVVRNKGFRGWRKFWKILRRFNIFETWKSSKIFGKIPRKLEKYWWDLKKGPHLILVGKLGKFSQIRKVQLED